MALTRTPEPPPGPADPWVPAWIPAFGPPTMPARPPAQGAVFGVFALTILIVAGAAEAPPGALVPILGLVAGIATGLATGAHRLVDHVAGVAMAVVAMIVTSIAVGAFLYSTGLLIPPITIVVVGLFVLGLDWQKVGRLRLLPFACGVFVIPIAGMERGWAYAAALAWLAASVGALWLLQGDERAALPQPVPVAPPSGATPGGGRPGDLAGTLGLALAIGVTAALLLGRPSCTSEGGSGATGSARVDEGLNPGQRAGRSGPRGRAGPQDPREIPPERRSGGGSGGGEVGSEGGEREIQVDRDGDRYVQDPRTGEVYDVTEEGGRTVIRDRNGNVVAELDEDGVVAGDRGGNSQRYRVDEDGRYYVETPDGERLHLGVDDDGNTVLTDDQGNVVAEGGPSDDHLVIRDPDGDVLAPDPDGDGEIPGPNGGVRNALPGTEGTEYADGGDTLTATDPDGEVRTYDRDATGRERVTVERPGQPTKVYVYDDTGDDLVVLEYDENGDLLRRYRYDPEGVLIDPAPIAGEDPPEAAADGQATGGAAEDATSPGDIENEDKDKDRDGESHLPWLIAGAAAALVLAGVGAWWWRRRTPAVPQQMAWAEALVTRIEDHGAAHGRPRAGDETIVAYTAALAGDVLPDPRLGLVGVALSAALFGPAPPPRGEEAQLTAVIDEVIEAHPIPNRADRRRARAEADGPAAPVGVP